MTRQEFLDTLQMQLQGRLDPAQIEGHLHYYREYISEAVAAGRPESEVLEELGSPIQIAMTLISAADFAESDPYAGEPEEKTGDWTEEVFRSMFRDIPEEADGKKPRVFYVNPKVLKCVILIALFLILFLIFSGLGIVLSLVARYFLPLLFVVLIIKLLRSR